MKKAEINFRVDTDINHLPLRIEWQASDSGVEQPQECKSVMISIWDPNTQQTLKIDLWTNEMLVDEMKLFFYQTMLSMASTLERATGEDKMAGDMRDFCAYFAEKMQLNVTPPEL
jgi:gliding motility-associated protein GldC